MGKWLAEFQEKTLETDNQTTDSTDRWCDVSALSVHNQGIFKHNPIDRWNPELSTQGYIWCFDCEHFDSVNCNNSINPFHTVTKCPQAPRKCQWFQKIV